MKQRKETLKNRRNRRNFTLIEVVVVIIILVTLASIATPMYLGYVKKANVGAARTQLKLLQDAITGYKLDVGSYPESLSNLVTKDEQNEKWDGPY
ncbi:MAG: type II secretion system protein GspG, partial [Lentisphaeria bacterium]|nr:type II secretion system protein GspG [Lentisphaeria bacterium]